MYNYMLFRRFCDIIMFTRKLSSYFYINLFRTSRTRRNYLWNNQISKITIELKLFSLNVRGLRNPRKRRSIFFLLKRPKLCCLFTPRNVLPAARWTNLENGIAWQNIFFLTVPTTNQRLLWAAHGWMLPCAFVSKRVFVEPMIWKWVWFGEMWYIGSDVQIWLVIDTLYVRG